MGDIFAFPFAKAPKTAAIDQAVRGFAVEYAWFFDGIKSALTGFVASIFWC
jgi:hypothetical protein